MLRQNQWHFKHMPALTYVAQFDFITPLSLEQCYQRLLEAARDRQHRGKTNIYEVLPDHNHGLFFAAKFALNQSAWYLAGHVKPEDTQKENRVVCYTGIPIITFGIPFLFLVVVLIVVGLTKHLSVIAVGLLFVAIVIVFGLVGMRYVRSFRQGLEHDIRELLSADSLKNSTIAKASQTPDNLS
jgi:hypothetical protein